MKYDVFISYSRKDTAIADQICAAFDKVGISYFIDRQGIGGGMEFPKILAENILDSQIFLFLGSKNSYESKFTNNEILFAFNKKPHNSLLPYLIDNTPLPINYQFTFASINIHNIIEHPIETVLIDDVYKLLGREKLRTESVSQDIQYSEYSSNELDIPKKYPEYGFKSVFEIWFSKIGYKKLLCWEFGGIILFMLFCFIMALFVDHPDPAVIYLGGVSILIMVLVLILAVRKLPNYSLSDVADYIQKNPFFPMFQKFTFPIFVKKEKFGVLDGNLNIIIPAEYDKLSWKTKNKILVAEQNGETFLMDIKGNRL